MVNHLGSTFGALSDPTRFQVVELLQGRELSAGEIAARCEISGPALSRHLRVLRRTGLVEVVQTRRTELDARLRVYRLRPEPFWFVKDWVDQMQSFWMNQLTAFKAHTERQHGRGPAGAKAAGRRAIQSNRKKGPGK